MARQHTIAQHPRRDEIDAALVSGEASRAIARRFGVSRHAVDRYRDGPFRRTLSRVTEIQEARETVNVVDRLHALLGEMQGTLDRARSGGNLRAEIAAGREVRGCLETAARLAGAISDQANVQVNVVTSTEWTELRAKILAALRPYPDALEAVIQAVGDGQDDGA